MNMSVPEITQPMITGNPFDYSSMVTFQYHPIRISSLSALHLQITRKIQSDNCQNGYQRIPEDMYQMYLYFSYPFSPCSFDKRQSRISSTVVRVILDKIPTAGSESVSAGSMMNRISPVPDGGSILSFRLKRSMIKRPLQKTGTLIPETAQSEIILSMAVFFLNAEIKPSKSPPGTAIIIAPRAKFKGIRKFCLNITKDLPVCIIRAAEFTCISNFTYPRYCLNTFLLHQAPLVSSRSLWLSSLPTRLNTGSL